MMIEIPPSDAMVICALPAMPKFMIERLKKTLISNAAKDIVSVFLGGKSKHTPMENISKTLNWLGLKHGIVR